MRKVQNILILILILAIMGCTQPPNSNNDVEVVPTATPTLPNPQVHVTPAPDVEAAIDLFMGAWQVDDYERMYTLISSDVRNVVTEEEFITRYRETANAMTLKFDSGIEYTILATVVNPGFATARLQVNYNTNLFDTFTREFDINLVREAGEWHVQWHEGVVLPDLEGGNTLEMVRQTTPRGNIYANNGFVITAQEDAVAIGFVPADLDRNLLSLFLGTMARLTIYEVDEILEIIDNALPTNYIPLGEATREAVDANMSSLSALSGIYLNYYTSRFYFDGGIAPQAVGHLTYISQEEMDRYLRLGYSPNERFGSTGLEFAFENELSGERGGALYLKDPEGQIITRLAERTATPGQSITTTIDPRLQFLLQQSLGNFRGAIVVMEIDTGRILAMVSNPQFDPNLFDINNQNFFHAVNPYTQPNDPVFNRATNGQYPLGSVFKIVTMAAALESETFDSQMNLYCGHSIVVCGNELFDWTYEKERPPSGDLNLPEGLMRSCNPWFYHIGEQLWLEGKGDAIADMARGFGLGQLTGVEIAEQPGNIPAQMASCELNTQLAIGQGEMLVTPLQVANFMAAVGNGGTLYRPALVEQIGPDGGAPTYTFTPEVIGTLPVRDEKLDIIEGALREVIVNARGTAQIQLGTMRYRSYGKTGTAENPFGRSHAWFAGYTQVNSPNRPDIAVVVILENAGEGSEMAAPVFRRAVSLYFSNYTDAGRVFSWEARPYVVASPTPLPTDTPIPTIPPPPTETPEGWDGEEEPEE